VDYLRDVEHLAVDERGRIEREYGNRLEELDNLLEMAG
jgi:hypothetical protein